MGHMGVAQRTPIRVLLADDHTIVRSGDSQILSDEFGMRDDIQGEPLPALG